MEKKNEWRPVADAGNAAEKEKYEAPVMEIVEVLVERGVMLYNDDDLSGGRPSGPGSH
jgi:hypothetical protein